MKNRKFTNYKKFYIFFNIIERDLNKYLKKKKNKKFKISNKKKSNFEFDPVTNFDKACEKFIISKISKKFPFHKIIGEEFGNNKKKSDYSWVIDPIDGTRSFIVGNPTWSNLISLNFKGEPVMGLANFPELDKYYLNYDNKLAYVFENGKKKRIKTNKKVPFHFIKLAAAFHGALPLKKQQKIPKFLRLMQYPCFDALTYAQLAEGKVDAVVQCANKIWDIHALIPIIRASGGIITTWDNKDPVMAGNIAVSNNKKNHKIILKLLKPAIK